MRVNRLGALFQNYTDVELFPLMHQFLPPVSQPESWDTESSCLDSR